MRTAAEFAAVCVDDHVHSLADEQPAFVALESERPMWLTRFCRQDRRRPACSLADDARDSVGQVALGIVAEDEDLSIDREALQRRVIGELDRPSEIAPASCRVC